MAIWKKEYKNFDEFENDRCAGNYELMAVVNNARFNTGCADLMTDCKNWRTAVRRCFDGWEECIIESIENGCWKDREAYWNSETGKYEYRGGWFYEVEDNDGSFYICLNVAA